MGGQQEQDIALPAGQVVDFFQPVQINLHIIRLRAAFNRGRRCQQWLATNPTQLVLVVPDKAQHFIQRGNHKPLGMPVAGFFVQTVLFE